MSAELSEFEPDQVTLDLLRSDYEHVWIGPKLTNIANRIRNDGGSEQDYRQWVLASNLWLSYEGSTSNSARDRRANLAGAWDKSEGSKPFDLHDALCDLAERIASSRWVGRSGSRNREVGLAFVRFCQENNCFTRTISTYELSKHTHGLSPMTVGRALLDLVNRGLLSKVDRTDRRVSNRSTCRYQVNLWWTDPKSVRSAKGNSGTDAMSTAKDSLPQLRNIPGQDLWSSRGLGLTAGRVYEALADEPATISDLSERAGLSQQATRRAAVKLADYCLAGTMPGRPARYFKVETPLSAIEDMLGCSGYVDHVVSRTEARQEANRVGYPSNYAKPRTW